MPVGWGVFMRVKVAMSASKLHRAARATQGPLTPPHRQQHLHRLFRLAIVVLTLLVLVGLWAVFPSGRASILALGQRAKWRLQRKVGLEPDRSEVDSYWRDRRDRREVSTRGGYNKLFAALAPDRQSFLRAAGMGPEDAVIRWGNYDMTLAMSGKVFVSDDSGCCYRLRPGVSSAWFRKVDGLGTDVCQLLFPDTSEVRLLAKTAGAEVFPGATHTTNSWGCRGPEPRMDDPMRVLVLGDSFMQGYLVGDGGRPPTAPPKPPRRARNGRLGAKYRYAGLRS